MSVKRDVESASKLLINNYLISYFNTYNDKNLTKIERLRMMRKLKKMIICSLEEMEEYIIESR